jgi:hypothetical protein
MMAGRIVVAPENTLAAEDGTAVTSGN